MEDFYIFDGRRGQIRHQMDSRPFLPLPEDVRRNGCVCGGSEASVHNLTDYFPTIHHSYPCGQVRSWELASSVRRTAFHPRAIPSFTVLGARRPHLSHLPAGLLGPPPAEFGDLPQ